MMRRAASTILAVVLGVTVTAVAGAAAAKDAKAATGRHAVAHSASTHTGRAMRFRPGRTAAAAEARRLGAAVGQGCTGKADLARNDHEWVVLCSNGKTYVVATPAQHAGAPAVECSLAGTGPQPACFSE
jgi:hypothetical protein